jgi:hypothetical protein
MIYLKQFGNVPGNLVQKANLTIGVLNEIFSAFPGKFRFTSGYRSPAHNASVNGVPNSYHVKALAGDFVPVNGVFSNSDLNSIGEIVSTYGFEVLKHNAGSGMHYHIEPSGLQNIPIVNVFAGAETVNPLLLVAGAFLLILLLRD